MKKDRLKQEQKELQDLARTDPDAYLNKLDAADRARIKVIFRNVYNHNCSAWLELI